MDQDEHPCIESGCSLTGLPGSGMVEFRTAVGFRFIVGGVMNEEVCIVGNIPDPIMEPATIMVASVNPRVGLKTGSAAGIHYFDPEDSKSVGKQRAVKKATFSCTPHSGQ